MWWVKLIVIVLLLAVFSLGRALMGLVQGDSKSKTMRARLAGRVFGRIFLFILFSMMGTLRPMM